MVRRLLSPRWLGGLALALAGAVAMLVLGRWQLHRGASTHSLQNYAYAIEWVLFAAFTLFCFYRLMRDAARAEAGELPDDAPPSYDTVVAPARRAVIDEEPDPELEAYNAYLARLDAEQRR